MTLMTIKYTYILRGIRGEWGKFGKYYLGWRQFDISIDLAF